ncbi:MAG TPA: ATP-binding protein, partial [Nannocystaceae bacterium]|nr:ATP-binding protein [Nannocystaceae bacterium]
MRRTLAAARAELGIVGTFTALVAVSGGADSMALLGLLERVARADALRLVVGHVDHGLRASSGAEAELVVATARARGHAHACTRIALAPGAALAVRARDRRREA